MKERNLFITKVFTVVSGQLLASFGMSCIPLFIPSVQNALYGNPYAVSIAFFFCLVNLCALYYNKNKSPENVVLLSTLTFFDAYLIGMVIAAYHPMIVAKALLCTGSLSGGVVVYAYVNREYDFSWLRGWIIGGVSSILVAMATQFVFQMGSVLNTVISFSSSILFGSILMYDAWYICREHPVDEYVTAVIDLHLSVINIFFNMLYLLKSMSVEDSSGTLTNINVV
jgi:FtsH-binding integral membrane protein